MIDLTSSMQDENLLSWIRQKDEYIDTLNRLVMFGGDKCTVELDASDSYRVFGITRFVFDIALVAGKDYILNCSFYCNQDALNILGELLNLAILKITLEDCKIVDADMAKYILRHKKVMLGNNCVFYRVDKLAFSCYQSDTIFLEDLTSKFLSATFINNGEVSFDFTIKDVNSYTLWNTVGNTVVKLLNILSKLFKKVKYTLYFDMEWEYVVNSVEYWERLVFRKINTSIILVCKFIYAYDYKVTSEDLHDLGEILSNYRERITLFGHNECEIKLMGT